ncbi:hypothetical protein, partial [Micromonospora sp. NPDC049799]|uniref:hypothetical protein n=1 Tax=Micromonospora sp. NPDC049799 TaxID=3154741 RepID=UPI00340073BF
LISLARDMAQTGQSNPAELPIAVKHGSKYLILEGNRRFAALKLMRDPALADDEAHQKAFRRAAALGTPPATVFTLVTSSREEADHWIVLRHTGENGGRGIKRWSAAQTATHRRRANKSVDSGTLRSIAIADELEEAYAADQDLADLIRKTRREKLTNIGRFFSNDVLTALHLTIRAEDSGNLLRDRTLWAHHTAGQLRDFFFWAFDLVLNNPVDAYKNPTVRRRALLTVPHLIPNLDVASDNASRLADRSATQPTADSGEEASEDQEPTSASSTGGAGGSQGSGSHGQDPDQGEAAGGPEEDEDDEPKTQARRKHEAKPERYLFQGLRLPKHPLRIQQLLKECRNLDVEQYPGVACVMARIMVELSVSTEEVLKISGAKEKDSLKVKVVSMLRVLDPDIEHPVKRKRKELAQAYLEASDYGIQYLNGFVHNPDLRPDPQLARRFSKAFRPFLEQVDGAL